MRDGITLDCLAPEIKIMILGKTDIKSLHSLVLTNKSFSEAYKSNKTTIHHAIVANTTGPLLHRAVAAYASSNTRWRGAYYPKPDNSGLLPKVHEFGRKYLDHTAKELPIKKEEFTYPMVVEMIKLHKVVEEWALKYIEWSLGQYHECWDKEGPVARPSATEIARVQATLYTIQITRGLLPVIIDYENRHRPWRMLWHYFAPWENLLAQELDTFFQTIIADHSPDDETLEQIEEELWGTPVQTQTLPRVWLAKWGLLGLAKLQNPEELLHSFRRLAWERLHYAYQIEIYDVTDVKGYSWFPLATPGDGRWYRLNVDSIRARWPEEESGPRDLWYLSMVEDNYPDRVVRSEFVTLGSTGYRLVDPEEAKPEEREILFEGPGGPKYYVINEGVRHHRWWDRSRLEAIADHTLPQIEEMNAICSDCLYDGETYDCEPYIHDIDFHTETGSGTMHGTSHDGH